MKYDVCVFLIHRLFTCQNNISYNFQLLLLKIYSDAIKFNDCFTDSINSNYSKRIAFNTCFIILCILLLFDNEMESFIIKTESVCLQKCISVNVLHQINKFFTIVINYFRYSVHLMIWFENFYGS